MIFILKWWNFPYVFLLTDTNECMQWYCSLKWLLFDDLSLQPFPVAENKTGPMTIDFLTKRLLALGANQTGGFLVDCETFHSMPPLGKWSMRILHLDSVEMPFELQIQTVRYKTSIRESIWGYVYCFVLFSLFCV